mmetsp:Transcript_116998/g.335672  ORF Transcript_116998/g.335672 Transcript_116998/m.335672 type:complete len:285 (+) Transcript_116998:81-935(+)
MCIFHTSLGSIHNQVIVVVNAPVHLQVVVRLQLVGEFILLSLDVLRQFLLRVQTLFGRGNRLLQLPDLLIPGIPLYNCRARNAAMVGHSLLAGQLTLELFQVSFQKLDLCALELEVLIAQDLARFLLPDANREQRMRRCIDIADRCARLVSGLASGFLGLLNQPSQLCLCFRGINLERLEFRAIPNILLFEHVKEYLLHSMLVLEELALFGKLRQLFQQLLEFISHTPPRLQSCPKCLLATVDLHLAILCRLLPALLSAVDLANLPLRIIYDLTDTLRRRLVYQ